MLLNIRDLLNSACGDCVNSIRAESGGAPIRFLLSTAVHTTKPAETPNIFFVQCLKNANFLFQIGTQVREHLFSFLHAHFGLRGSIVGGLAIIQNFFSPRSAVSFVFSLEDDFQFPNPFCPCSFLVRFPISAHLRNLRQNFFWLGGPDLSFGRRSAWMISWLYGVRIEGKSCSGWARHFGFRFPF